MYLVFSHKLFIMLFSFLDVGTTSKILEIPIFVTLNWGLNINIWFNLPVIKFLIGTTVVIIVSLSRYTFAQNNITILFRYRKKKSKCWLNFAYFRFLKNRLSSFPCLWLDIQVSGSRGYVEFSLLSRFPSLRYFTIPATTSH